MAAMTFSDLTNLLLENYGPMVVDNVIRQGPGNWFISDQSIMGRLRALGRIFTGGADGNDRYVRDFSLKLTGKTATSYGENDAYPASTSPTWTDGNIGWKRNGVTIEIDNLVRLATRRGSMRGNLNGLGTQVRDALKAIIDAMEQQLALDGTGNSSKNIDGIAAFMSTSNTYAGISQSGQALWQANISAAGAAALSKTLMRTLVRAAYNRNALGDDSEFWMDLLQFQKFATLYNDSIRYLPGQMAGSTIPHYADGAFMFPIYVVKGVPTDEVWLMKTNDLELRFLDHTPEDELSEIADEEMFHEGVPIGFEKVETGKDSKAIFLKAYANLCCTNPYNQSAITGLATTAP